MKSRLGLRLPLHSGQMWPGLDPQRAANWS